ncbi:hypothetical protein Lesp02_54110 [Lentzea sp. NBRC 105346]|uniref:hypothetical protein n=1 Tax=Lentzea sp. NBRC 105346 TaxID=3032205 RepID=UPI0024A28BA5|nr:hypothetical protein [Lentzea sp. NBRC 105346]GLZ33223.1 hypothetical protein Lesp02_54110 [Lentzea sp. NBRC 105346]
MGEQFKVVPEELRGYGELLDRNAQHFLTIKEHAVSKGGDTSGFTGLLTLLHPVVTGVANLFGETLDFGNKMMLKEADALRKAAEHYEAIDGVVERWLGTCGTALESAGEAPKFGGAR